MLVSNFWNYKAFIESRDINGGNEWRKIDIGILGLDGANVQFQLMRTDVYGYNYPVMAYLGVKSGLGVIVGTGTTEPTVSDYSLTTDVTATFINRTLSYNTGSDGSSVKTILTWAGVNPTSDPITLTEYGITKAINFGNQATTPALIMHELFPEPIVVPAGSGITIPIEWTEQ